MNVAHSVPSTVSSVSFSFLTSEDIRRISVKQIKNSAVLEYGRPVYDGLYDPALGPSDRSDMCVDSILLLCFGVYGLQLRNLSSHILHLSRSLWSCRTAVYRVPSTLHGEHVQSLARCLYVLS